MDWFKLEYRDHLIHCEPYTAPGGKFAARLYVGTNETDLEAVDTEADCHFDTAEEAGLHALAVAVKRLKPAG